MLKQLKVSSSLSSRVFSSASTIATHNGTIAARPYKEVPKVSFLDMMKNPFTAKEPSLPEVGKWVNGLYLKHGPIFRLMIPGGHDQIFLIDPRDIRSLHQKEGNYPLKPSFEHSPCLFYAGFLAIFNG